MMTGVEHLLAMGEPLISDPPLPCFIGSFVRTLPSTDQKRIAGMAYETTCFSFFLLYAMCNLTFDTGSAACASSSDNPTAASAIVSRAPPIAASSNLLESTQSDQRY